MNLRFILLSFAALPIVFAPAVHATPIELPSTTIVPAIIAAWDGSVSKFPLPAGDVYTVSRDGDTNTLVVTDPTTNTIVHTATFTTKTTPVWSLGTEQLPTASARPATATVTQGCTASGSGRYCADTIVNDNFGPVYNEMDLQGGAAGTYYLYRCNTAYGCNTWEESHYANAGEWYASSHCVDTNAFQTVWSEVLYGFGSAQDGGQYVFSHHYC